MLFVVCLLLFDVRWVVVSAVSMLLLLIASCNWRLRVMCCLLCVGIVAWWLLSVVMCCLVFYVCCMFTVCCCSMLCVNC